jgi:hypothetical protein
MTVTLPPYLVWLVVILCMYLFTLTAKQVIGLLWFLVGDREPRRPEPKKLSPQEVNQLLREIIMNTEPAPIGPLSTYTTGFMSCNEPKAQR